MLMNQQLTITATYHPDTQNNFLIVILILLHIDHTVWFLQPSKVSLTPAISLAQHSNFPILSKNQTMIVSTVLIADEIQ